MSPEQPHHHEPGSPDEVDRRFEELMRREFTSTRPQPEPYSLESAVEQAIPDPVEDQAPYRDVEVLENRWSLGSTAGFVLLTGGLVSALVMLFGVRLPAPWPQVSAVVAVAGLVILLVKALRVRPGEDDLDHGATL